MPTKKRKVRRTLILVSAAFVLLLVSSLGAGIYLYITNFKVISPLPAQLGSWLPTSSSDQSEKDLTSLLRSRNIMYTAIARNADEFVITLNPKQQVILTREKNFAEQISSLQVILQQLTMEGREFRTLDLRFDKPVVR